jgi:predicted transcriptional regulator
LKLAEVQEILGAKVLFGEDLLQREVAHACGSDLLSDVLTFTKPNSLLLTGLVNPQVVRTAELLNLVGIVFVRGKEPASEVLELAEEMKLPLLSTAYPLYETAGLLWEAGLAGCKLP